MADDWKGPPIETVNKLQTLMFEYFIASKEAEGTGQPVAWYADTPERPLVQYENGQGQLFQLTASSGG